MTLRTVSVRHPDRQHPYERRNRAVKVERLVRALDVEAMSRGLNPLDPQCARGTADILESAIPEFWTQLADKAGTTIPSPESIRQVVAWYRGRAGR